VGIIRVKPTGHLRHFINVDGKKDYDLANVRRLDFELVRRDWWDWRQTIPDFHGR